ncbi:hypothetical protein OGR47_07395 [Methylocystis sp. MJC1]|nr:hypothetical protein [Methylocystis sp. MJC1]UZX13255.1 hypothetical protein OGR47_07395 [Methylocystis sp. MJC1]
MHAVFDRGGMNRVQATAFDGDAQDEIAWADRHRFAGMAIYEINNWLL